MFFNTFFFAALIDAKVQGELEEQIALLYKLDKSTQTGQLGSPHDSIVHVRDDVVLQMRIEFYLWKREA
jgi:hypothetical protein